LRRINETNANGKITWYAIELGRNDVLYEWTVLNSDKYSDSHFIERIISGEDRVLKITYNFLAPPIPAEKRRLWINILKATLKKVHRKDLPENLTFEYIISTSDFFYS